MGLTIRVVCKFGGLCAWRRCKWRFSRWGGLKLWRVWAFQARRDLLAVPKRPWEVRVRFWFCRKDDLVQRRGDLGQRILHRRAEDGFRIHPAGRTPHTPRETPLRECRRLRRRDQSRGLRRPAHEFGGKGMEQREPPCFTRRGFPIPKFSRQTPRINLKTAMGCHAKAQRRKEEALVGTTRFTLQVSAFKSPSLCAFAPLREFLPFHRRF